VHRTGALFGQFKTLEQQKDTATLGMWIFLVTEVMFFGGIMLAYTINRHTYFHAFAMGSNTLSLGLGGFNTVVLLASSFTMAMAVWSAQTSRKNLITLFLSLTILLGFVFFGVKYVEYAQKFHHHLVPGKTFDIFYCVNNPAKCEDIDAADMAKEKEEIQQQIDSIGERRKTILMLGDDLCHAVIGKLGHVRRGLRRRHIFDGRHRKGEDLLIIRSELFHHAKTRIQIVQHRNLEPAPDRGLVGDHIHHLVEIGLGENVRKDVDLLHGAVLETLWDG